MQTLLIYYPHLFLFAYHLQKKIQENNSWKELRQRLHIKSEVELNQEYFFDLRELEGYYQQTVLGDTASFLVYGSTKGETTPQELECLSRFREYFEVKADIGKTWLILGYLSDDSLQDVEKIAISAYQEFDKTSEIPSYQKGRFLGASFFEFNQNNNQDSVYICLCPNLATMEAIAPFYYEWLSLFYSRHKILWSYANSRQIKEKMASENFFPNASEIPNFTLSLDSARLREKELQSLKVSLCENYQTLAKHTIGLESLAIQLETFRTNLKNYQFQLNNIKSKAKQETNLDFFEEFGSLTSFRYQTQMEQDYASLSPGLRVREEYINTVQGLLAVVQDERDRALNRNIFIVSAGIGTASASASSIANFAERIIIPADSQDPVPDSYLWGSYFFALVLSLGVGAIASAFVYGIMKVRK